MFDQETAVGRFIYTLNQAIPAYFVTLKRVFQTIIEGGVFYCICFFFKKIEANVNILIQISNRVSPKRHIISLVLLSGA